MPRTIIDIPEVQLREVDRLCQQLAISRAEAVRRGLRHWIEQHTEVSATGFGLWQEGEPPAPIQRLATPE